MINNIVNALKNYPWFVSACLNSNNSITITVSNNFENHIILAVASTHNVEILTNINTIVI